MKRCPTCNQTFDDESLSYCLNDGTSLVGETPSTPNVELQATMMATPPSLGGASYPPPPPPPGPSSGSFDPPQQSQSWAQPSVAKTTAAQKSSGMNKKLIFGGIGCVVLAGIVLIVAIVLLIAFSGATSKMNPYKGDMKALVPENVGAYKRVDIDPMRERDRKSLGKVNDGLGVEYKGGTDESEINMLVGNYSSSKDAEDGLKSFTDEGVNTSWTRSEKGSKKIGWRTVGIRYVMTRMFSTGKVDVDALPDGARLLRAQTAEPAKSRQRQFIGWTNGSVLYVVGGYDTKAEDFEKIFDKEVK